MSQIKNFRRPLFFVALLASITGLSFYIRVLNSSDSNSRSTIIEIQVDMRLGGGLRNPIK